MFGKKKEAWAFLAQDGPKICGLAGAYQSEPVLSLSISRYLWACDAGHFGPLHRWAQARGHRWAQARVHEP